MKLVLQGIAVVFTGITIGKCCQYAAVEYLGDRIGFDLASAIGLAPFMAGLAVLTAKYPHILSYRRQARRG